MSTRNAAGPREETATVRATGPTQKGQPTPNDARATLLTISPARPYSNADREQWVTDAHRLFGEPDAAAAQRLIAGYGAACDLDDLAAVWQLDSAGFEERPGVRALKGADVPISPPMRDVSEFRHSMIQRLGPTLALALDRALLLAEGRLVVAGGAALAITLGKHQGWHGGDLDIFWVGDSLLDDKDCLVSVAKADVNEAIAELRNEVEIVSISLERHVVAVTVRPRPSRFPGMDAGHWLRDNAGNGLQPRVIQFILVRFPNTMSLLYNFDMPQCAVAYDGEHVWLTPEAAVAIATGRYVLRPDTERCRVAKYAARGYVPVGWSDVRASVDEGPVVCAIARKDESQKQAAIVVIPGERGCRTCLGSAVSLVEIYRLRNIAGQSMLPGPSPGMAYPWNGGPYPASLVLAALSDRPIQTAEIPPSSVDIFEPIAADMTGHAAEIRVTQKALDKAECDAIELREIRKKLPAEFAVAYLKARLAEIDAGAADDNVPEIAAYKDLRAKYISTLNGLEGPGLVSFQTSAGVFPKATLWRFAPTPAAPTPAAPTPVAPAK